MMLGRHLKGHLLRFERRTAPPHDAAAGLRLMLIFLLLESAIGPRLTLFTLLGWPVPPGWVRVPALLILALVLIRFFGRVTPAQIGLVPWREWSLTEKSYFIQGLVIATAIFGMLYAGRLSRVVADPALWGATALGVATHFLWGCYQELMYRGILQTELVRMWGVVPGILVSNLLFTFGPLHVHHFSGRTLPQALPMFAGIFAIGLFFGLLFRRSGNLAMVGMFHGLGDAWISGLSEGLAVPAARR